MGQAVRVIGALLIRSGILHAHDSFRQYPHRDRKARRTLLSCGLVCKEMHRISRKALFTPLWCSSAKEIKNISRLAKQYPSVGKQLRGLRQVVISGDDALAMFPHQFLCCKESLYSLRILRWGTNIRPRYHPLFYTLLSCFRELTSLSLIGCHFRTFTQFQRLVSAFPKLTILELERCQCDDLSDRLGRMITDKRPRLTSLVTRNSQQILMALYGWLVRTPSSKTITELVGTYETIHEDSLRMLLTKLPLTTLGIQAVEHHGVSCSYTYI